MSLGDKVRKLALKIGFSVLPWVGWGVLGAHLVNVASVTLDSSITDIEKVRKCLPTSALLGGVLALCAASTYASRKNRVILEKHNGLENIFDYPGISSFAISSGIFAPWVVACALKGEIAGISYEDNLALRALIGTSYVSLLSALYTSSDALSKNKSPCIKNFFKMTSTLYSKLSHKEELKILSEVSASRSSGLLEAQAMALAEQGDMINATSFWNAALNFERRSGNEKTLAINALAASDRRFSTAIELIRNNYKLRKNPNDRALLIRSEFLYLLRYQPQKAKALAEKIITLQGCTDDEKFLQSFILDYAGASERADALLKEVLTRHMQENGLAKLGSNLLYQKAGAKEQLVGESRLLLQLQRVCEKHRFEAARPLGIWGRNDPHYLLETFSDGTRLYEMLEENPDPVVLRKAALAQASLHGIVSRAEDKKPHEDILQFINAEPWGLDRQDLDFALESMLEPVWNHQAADCDGHRMNRHYNLNEQIVVYDLEPRGNSPIAFDYAKLFAQGRFPAHWETQKEILAESADTYNSIVSKELRISGEQLSEQTFRSAAYKALRYAAFVWKDASRHSTAIDFIGNAEKYINILKNTVKVDNRACKILLADLRTVNDALIGQSGHRPPMTSH